MISNACSPIRLTAFLFACALGAIASAEEWKEVRDEKLNFKIDFPGKVEVMTTTQGITVYSSNVKSGADFTQYLVSVIPSRGNEPDRRIRNFHGELRQQHDDFKILRSTPIACSGFYGEHSTTLFDYQKEDAFGGSYQLPSGMDTWILQVGDRVYHIGVNYWIYDNSFEGAVGYDDVPEAAQKFFKTFRILDPASVKTDSVRFPDDLRGSWLTDDDSPTELVTFLGNDRIMFLGALQGTFKIDRSTTPAQIDITFDFEPDTQRKGIFELDRDHLKLCLATEGTDERPSRLEKTDGSELYQLRRPGNSIIDP